MADDRAHFSRPAPLTDDPALEPTRPLVRRPEGPAPRLTQAVELAALIAALRDVVTTCDCKSLHTQDRVALARNTAASALAGLGLDVTPAPRSYT